MDHIEARALALGVVAEQNKGITLTTEMVLTEASKVSNWVLYGEMPVSPSKRERDEVGQAMRAIALREKPLVRSMSAEALIEGQPGEIVEPPHMQRFDNLDREVEEPIFPTDPEQVE